jgi:TetR/AcrR family transcriptional regulator, cholesterol catabolism regulator
MAAGGRRAKDAPRPKAGRPKASQNGDLSTSERVVDTAAAMFREKGYAETTTREVAAALGIHKASLYHHISSKEEVLLRICRNSLETINEVVSAAAAEAKPEDRLSTAIEAHLVEAVRARDLHAVMLIELRNLSSKNRKEVLALRDRYEATLRGIIVEDQGAGRVRKDIDAKYLTLSLLNVLNWTIFWFDPDGDLDAPSLGELLAGIYLQGAAA